MSFEAQNWADKIKVGNASQKAVLKTMANCADQEGYCWPSAAYIAASCEITIRTVWTAIEALEHMGLIVKTKRVRDNGSHKSNHYQMLLAVTSPVTEKQGGGSEIASLGVVKLLQGGSEIASPLESSIEPSLKDSSSPKPENEDDRKCAEWMFGKIKTIAPKAKAPNWHTWCNDIRLMRERDQHTLHDICLLFAWANADPFWASNVLSPHTLREKWTALWLKANSQAKTQGMPSPALATDPQRCHCGQPGAVMRNGIGWLCRAHRDALDTAGAQ